MKPQHQHTAVLLSAAIEPAALVTLTGGVLPIGPHDLVTSTNHGANYDSNNDDLLADLAPEQAPN